MRDDDRQEYLVCAALVPTDECSAAREQLRPLLLPGQVKFHWTDESERRRREIVSNIVDLGPMNVVVAHLDVRRKKTERYRRKSLETLYHELLSMDTFDLTLESRSDSQDKADRGHLVGLRSQGLNPRLRIEHERGGDEPLLWIADAVLGSINSAYLGTPDHLDELRSTLLIESRTPDSLQP